VGPEGLRALTQSGLEGIVVWRSICVQGGYRSLELAMILYQTSPDSSRVTNLKAEKLISCRGRR